MAEQPGWAGLFWAAFKRSQNAMALLDEQRRIVEVNGAALRLLGRRRAEVVGRPVYEFVEGGPVLSDEEWHGLLSRGESMGEATIERPNGTVRVQWAAHTETMTGRRLILFVVLNVERRRQFRRGVAARTGGLTEREQEVVHLVALGRSGPEIADELNISHNTVRAHIRNAQRKLGARSRAQLVAMALGEGHAAGAGR